MKLNEAQIEDLTGKVFRTIITNGKEGILQSELWKELDLTSRDGSRVAIRLEKRSLIRREKMLENGRWTYKLFAVKLPADTKSIESAPCLTCPVEHMCSLEGTYSPTSCNLIEDWLVTSFGSAGTAQAQIQKPIEPEVMQLHQPEPVRTKATVKVEKQKKTEAKKGKQKVKVKVHKKAKAAVKSKSKLRK